MAQEVVNKKVPPMMAAAMLGSQFVKTPKEQMSLKLRLHKMKESIITEATKREAQMKDREEKLVLTNALHMLEMGKPPDIEAVRSILEERLLHVQRRISTTEAEASHSDDEDSSSSSSSGDESEQEEGVGQPEVDQDGSAASSSVFDEITTEKYWQNLIHAKGMAKDIKEERGGLSAGASGEEFSQEETKEYREKLRDCGFLTVENDLAKENAGRVLHLIKSLGGTTTTKEDQGGNPSESESWPPIFAFMYDETWNLIRSVWKKVESLLDGPCVLEPSFTAFLLNYHKDQDPDQQRYVGTNFALPHRDYTYADSVFSNGDPKKLSVWIPLNQVTTENGCMYVVPREFDGNFDKDGSYDHLQVLTEGGLKGQQFLHFPLNGIRPLPGEAGTLMCWYGNLIHWGSSCHKGGAADPRASIALVFQRSDVLQDLDRPFLDLQDIDKADTKERLKLIKDAMSYFRHWYKDKKVPRNLAERLDKATSQIPPGHCIERRAIGHET